MLKFKNLDLVSKRILVFSLSISALLLSASLLIFAAKPANAQTPTFSNSNDGRRYDAVAGGGSSGYYLMWNTQTGAYKTISYNVINYQNSSNTSSLGSDTSEKFW